HLNEPACRRADGCERLGARRDEQPLTDNVVGLVRRRRTPLISDAPHNVLQTLERLKAVGSADLLGIASDGLGVVSTLRRRYRNGEQHSWRALDRFSQRLRERELVIEGSTLEIV